MGSILRRDNRKDPTFPRCDLPPRSDVGWSDTARDATVSSPSGTELFVAVRDKFSLRVPGRICDAIPEGKKSLCGVAAR